MKYIHLKNCKDTKGEECEVSWDEFAACFIKPECVNMLYDEYLILPKDEQTSIKDVGGYVLGEKKDESSFARKKGHVINKNGIVIDIDGASIDFLEYTKKLPFNYILHSTMKDNRYRIIIPVETYIQGGDYDLAYKWVCQKYFKKEDRIDLSVNHDNSLFFFPAKCKDRVDTYFFRYVNNKQQLVVKNEEFIADVEKTNLLFSKVDIHRNNPRAAQGYIGAFNRTYSVADAILEFLPHVYKSGSLPNRLTYINGSTANGVVIYKDAWVYSFHGTDPANGQLFNAFEIVAVHKYTEEYLQDGLSPKGECMKKMLAFCAKLPSLGQKLENEDAYTFYSQEMEGWKEELVRGKGATVKNLECNYSLIFFNDPNLKDMFYHDEFDHRNYVKKECCFNPSFTSPEPEDRVINDFVMANIRIYLGSYYGIRSRDMIMDALLRSLGKSSVDTLKQYITSLQWDGVERMQNVFHDYFGCTTDNYTSVCVRKFFWGAINRALNAGSKVDEVLILSGKQGIGKSLFFSKLGGKFFSDTFDKFEGKQAYEQIQGKWIVELPELAAMHKSDINDIKHFVSKQEDNQRLAYRHDAEPLKRRCIFVGTTNEIEILTDKTGNRRFLPIHCIEGLAKKTVWDDLTQNEVDMIWAEAYNKFMSGELKYEFSKQTIEEGLKMYEVDDPQECMIGEYLNTPLPTDWDTMGVFERIAYFDDKESIMIRGKVQRMRISVAEVWFECLKHSDKKTLDRFKSRDIGKMLISLGWERSNTVGNCGIYGMQRWYKRKTS